MRIGQLLRFSLAGLWRQKVRTILTLVGVTIGTCALAFSLSLGLGLREFIDREFKVRDDFWRIIVRVAELTPDPASIPSEKIAVHGHMSEERRALFFFSSRRRHTRLQGDWSSDVCSSD